MKEFIDKLISRLEEEKEGYSDTTYYALGIGSAIKIVNKLAEEYKVSEMPTGWISVSERLPEDSGRYLVDNGIWRGEGKFDIAIKEFNVSYVIAWMPLPAPYTEGE